jgi:hypothetical protein
MNTSSSRLLILPLLLMLAACTSNAPASSTATRSMDEVPGQQQLSNGDRQYSFANGCVIVLEARRAVVKTEGTACELHHRDIALLYASGD